MTYRLPALNGLKAFEAAARNLSFKHAATELGVTPGAVSQLVKKLETSLGVLLFRRLPQGLLLTSAGEEYSQRIAHIFDLLTEATEAIAPDINSRKFSVGFYREIFASMPDGWARQDETLQRNIREVICPADAEQIWTNQLDCLVGFRSGAHKNLAVRPICTGPEAMSGRDIVFISNTGLAHCRQSDEIIASVRGALGLGRGR